MEMEHPQRTVMSPPLVDDRALLRFCRAVQQYADTIGARDEAAVAIRRLRVNLESLRNLGSLCRLAIIGHPRSLDRVVDTMRCLARNFDEGAKSHFDHSDCACETTESAQLSAAIDLFAGASFASKDRPDQRNRFICGIVHAIKKAIAFPVTLSVEAATYLGEGDGSISPAHAELAMALATKNLIDGVCFPAIPSAVENRLYCLAEDWMADNPVDRFFAAIGGPRVRRIIVWADAERECPEEACRGDTITVLVEDEHAGVTREHSSSNHSPHQHQHSHGSAPSCCSDDLSGYGVVFCRHQPGLSVRPLRDGFHTVVPHLALTGPVAVVKLDADLTATRALVDRYAESYRDEWLFSIFSFVRMDHWDYPSAFEPPILKIRECRDAQKPPREPHPHTTSDPKQPKQPHPNEPHTHAPSKPMQPKPAEPYPHNLTESKQSKPEEPQPNTPTEPRRGPIPAQPTPPSDPTGDQLQRAHDRAMLHHVHHHTPGDHSHGGER